MRGSRSGCLLGGAIGDALGAPVEFLSLGQIRQRFGPTGVTGPVPAYGRIGAITDDTQMTLFTAEGLLGALGGEAALPADWVEPLEARDLIRQIATDLCQPAPRFDDDPEAWREHERRYPYDE